MPKKSYISPSIKAYSASPSGLSRDIAVDRQVKWDEQTLIWGDHDDLPLRIMNAVNRSPTTIQCLSTVESFIAGSGFTDEGLMTMPIDEDGTTLWEFHSKIAPYLALLESFAVNFRFNLKGKITESLIAGVETCRFKRPAPKSKEINTIRQNPYFGTAEYNKEYTSEFQVFDPETVKEGLKLGNGYGGQIYFFGTVRPPFKFYSVPKYWSAEHWIYVDAGIPEFNRQNMDNGFFQSALINVIGDPNQPSKNPKYMREETGTDNVKRKKSTKTVGEEFDEQMSSAFSGKSKAGTAMVLWSLNKDQAVNVSAFPVNSQFDILSGTAEEARKGICIATGVDPILLAIQGNGLVNSGDSIRAVIDYMQSKVTKPQQTLENFYNKIMFPNLETKTKAEVKIKNYIPITTAVTVDDKFWQVLTEAEKKEFVKTNISGMSEIIKDVEVTVDEETGEPLTPAETQVNEKITDLTGRQLQQLNRITRQFSRSEITFEQAKLLLKNGFNFTDTDVNAWLGVDEPVEGTKK
jgi:hypothetical protein